MSIKTVVDTVQHEVETLLGNHVKNKRFQSESAFIDESAARQAFERAKEKLFAVNDWSNLPGLTATFNVHDQRGNPILHSGPLTVGHYIRIELPGPLPPNWVRIVAITQDETMADFTVVPSESPQPLDSPSGQLSAPVDHFFTDEASSTFRVERVATQLIACEIGRNERVNNADARAGQRSVVNTLIAAGGWAVFQETQWKKLTEYLVQP